MAKEAAAPFGSAYFSNKTSSPSQQWERDFWTLSWIEGDGSMYVIKIWVVWIITRWIQLGCSYQAYLEVHLKKICLFNLNLDYLIILFSFKMDITSLWNNFVSRVVSHYLITSEHYSSTISCNQEFFWIIKTRTQTTSHWIMCSWIWISIASQWNSLIPKNYFWLSNCMCLCLCHFHRFLVQGTNPIYLRMQWGSL